MIAVIADDFTGAAEIGGIGLRYGLNVVIETEDILNHSADLLIIATDTRSLPAKEAAEHISEVTKELQKLHPDAIFKKIDSVLRGNIADELMAQMKASNKKKSIVVPANPVFNRFVKDGIYYINETPLAQTNFSSDPEYPVVSSDVVEIVRKGGSGTLVNLKVQDAMPDYGLIIGDVLGLEDLEKWVGRIDDDTLAAGSSGFFDAFLTHQKSFRANGNIPNVPFGETAFFVLGSTFPKGNDFMKKLMGAGCFVSNIPVEIFNNKNFDPDYMKSWVDEIVNGLQNYKKVAVTIIHAPTDEEELSFRLRENTGEMIKQVLGRIKVDELLIEGGATTSVALKCLNIKKLFPVQEFETGVIRMRTNGGYNMCITTKPGSYAWPEALI